MATDAWSAVRAGAVNLWQRVYPERAPAIDAELVDVREEIVAFRKAGDAEAEKELVADWRRKFRRLVGAHPELAPELGLLAEEWIRLAPAAHDHSAVSVVEQTAIATGRGTVYQAGGHQRITGA